MNGNRLLVLTGLLTSLIALSVGCAPTAQPLRREQDFSGFITEIHANGRGGIAGQVYVESHADKIVTRYVIKVTNKTMIFRRNEDDLRRVSFGTLEETQTVEIWWAGPTTGTFPVLGTAAQIVIR